MAKTIIIASIIFGVSALPIYPHGSLSTPDPVSISDKRVVVDITEEDLEEIIRIVRRPEWGGLWETISRLGKGNPILRISMPEEMPGQIFVETGVVKRPLQGWGYWYRMKKEGNEWILVSKSRWIA